MGIVEGLSMPRQGLETMAEIVDRALKLAKYAHMGQSRKFPRPGESEPEDYIKHPMRVAESFTQLYDWRLVVVALLHDVIENTEISLSQVRDFFGADVANAVDAICIRDGETYTDYIDRLYKNKLARYVKIVDLRDNMVGLPEGHHLIERYNDALKRLSIE